jgi:hypothetical protein
MPEQPFTDADLDAVKVLIAHQRLDIGSCICGWGVDTGDLGRDHSLHIWRELQRVALPAYDARVRARAGEDAARGERWRVGTSPGTHGRTIYRHMPDGPERGKLIGLMDTREDAALAVEAVNHQLHATGWRWEYGVEMVWPDGRSHVDLRGSREAAEGVLAAQAEITGNVVTSRLVRRLLTFGLVEEVPDGD